MKKLLTLLLMGSLGIGLVGCVDIEEEDTAVDCVKYPTHTSCMPDVDPDDPDAPGIITVLDELPAEQIEVIFWHTYGETKSALLMEIIDSFEELYPSITITPEFQGSYDDIRDNTIFAISSGETPTLLVGYPDHVAGYLNGNAVVPLDDFIKHETWGIDLDDFIDSYLDENRQYIGGYMYSLPYSKSTEMMVFNKTRLEALGQTIPTDRPLTFDEIEDLAEIMVGDGPNQCEYLLNYDSSANFFINMVRQFDGGYTNAAGDILVDDPNTIAMLEYVQSLFEIKTLSLPLAWNVGYGSDNFKAEDVCMTVGSTAGISYNIPPGDEFEIGIAPIPQYDENNLSAVQQGPNIAIMSFTTDEQRLAAWIFITYITNAENTAAWSMDTGYLPVRYSAYDSDVFKEFLTNPDPDYIFESMTVNAASLQLSYNQYDPAFAGTATSTTTSSGARLQAGIVMDAIYAGSDIQDAIEDMLYQLGAS